MAKKTNWQILQSKDPHDSVKYRDVYEDQQLERSDLGENQSPLSRIILCVVIGILVAGIVYCFFSLFESGAHTVKTLAEGNVSSLIVKSSDTASNPKNVPVYNPNKPLSYVGSNGGKYFQLNSDGTPVPGGHLYDSAQSVPEPKWHADAKLKYEEGTMGYWLLPDLLKVVVSLVAGLITFGILYPILMRNLAAQNVLTDTSDINQYKNDQHISLPEEVQQKFDIFPDVGAHSNVQPSSMISHMMLSNKGLKKVQMSVRASKDEVDDEGNVDILKGEILRDEDGKALTKTVPIIDSAFGHDLFTASGIPKNDKKLRKFYDPSEISYNPKNADRDKLKGRGKYAKKGYETFADVINDDWIIPEYETQRPAGIYMVDVQPVNTIKNGMWREKYVAMC